MKFAIESGHRDFFSKKGHIEFANLLTEPQLAKLNLDITQALVNRLELLSHHSLEKTSANNQYEVGRDLWKTLPAIKKIVCNTSLAEIAWEFCQERPLRIGYDQFLPAQNGKKTNTSPENHYKKFLNSTDKTIAEISCIQGVTSALIICLTNPNKEIITKEAVTPAEGEEQPIFPTTPGNGIFVSVDLPMNFSLLDRDCDYLLITYATRNSVYVRNEEDPLFHVLRQWNYTYSDALNDKQNPIIIR